MASDASHAHHPALQHHFESLEQQKDSSIFGMWVFLVTEVLGKFFGGNELVTPYGAAYTVRVLVDRGLVEERAVFLLHPDGSGRLLVVRLRYPPGDNEAVRLRMLQALELVGTLEPLAAPAGG